MRPTIGRIVLYRSRTGTYTVPAMITATTATLAPKGVELHAATNGEKGVPPLSGDLHVHLAVFTPGIPGMRVGAADFVAREDTPISENVAGVYQEWDVPPVGFVIGEPGDPISLHATIDGNHPADLCQHAPGSWAWPAREGSGS